MTGNAPESVDIVRFLSRIGRLKAVARTGWLDRGLPPIETESVADHSFRVALFAWLAAAERGLDPDRVLKLALIHDLAEAITGDRPPYDPGELAATVEADRSALLNRRHVRSEADRARKKAAERAAFDDLTADLPPLLRDELDNLWRELETAETAEARFVKQVDKLETFLQSREYLAEHPDLPVESFASEVAEVIDDPLLVMLRDDISRLDENDRREGSPS
jgi:putative hydrolase of HD superfamily